MSSKFDMVHDYFECKCNSPEHTLRFTYFIEEFYDNEEEMELYLQIFLSTGGFWYRLKEGVKYIFGHKSRYGHFGEWIMKDEDAERLREMLDKMIEFNKPKSE